MKDKTAAMILWSENQDSASKPALQRCKERRAKAQKKRVKMIICFSSALHPLYRCGQLF
jgi:hypothetical protein